MSIQIASRDFFGVHTHRWCLDGDHLTVDGTPAMDTPLRMAPAAMLPALAAIGHPIFAAASHLHDVRNGIHTHVRVEGSIYRAHRRNARRIVLIRQADDKESITFCPESEIIPETWGAQIP